MAKKNSRDLPSEPAESMSAFVPPFAREEFERCVLATFLLQLRQLAWMTDGKTAWQVLGKDYKGVDTDYFLFSTEYTADSFGLSFCDIAGTEFAKVMMRLYDFAYFGLLDQSDDEGRLDLNTQVTWIAAIVATHANSPFAGEWDWEGTDEAVKCLRVVETANARKVLEGDEPFSYFLGHEKGSGAAGEGALTVAQLALLSGMEEMSIRSATHPKRANPLQTFSENGRVRIAVDVAREWLKSKGRYVPVRKIWSAGVVDLSAAKFDRADDLLFALNDCCGMRLADAKDAAALKRQLESAGVRFSDLERIDIPREVLLDEAAMRTIASLLDLPPDLLVLRAREVVLRGDLAQIESSLRSMRGTANN